MAKQDKTSITVGPLSAQEIQRRTYFRAADTAGEQDQRVSSEILRSRTGLARVKSRGNAKMNSRTSQGVAERCEEPREAGGRGRLKKTGRVTRHWLGKANHEAYLERKS